MRRGIGKTALVVCITFILASSPAFASDEARFARYPAPSPDGSSVAFSYHGDIWVVPAAGGRALRLTVHEAYDAYPVWSPDGSKIAFSSDRFGNDDVYVMPASGGGATRLTFMTLGDTPLDWSADGSMVLFNSSREYNISGATRVPYVFSISTSGGEPKMFMPESGNEARLSPDGTKLAFVNHSRRDWGRIGYRGPSHNDIWIWNIADDTYERVTDFNGVDAVPMWSGDGNALYYLSEENGIFNIWRADLVSGEKTQVTNHDDHVRFPGISRDGKLIAYELGLDIYTLDTATGEAKKLEIVAPSESKFNSTERVTQSRGADEYALSPDEKEIAFIVRGELFCMDAEGGKANRLTESVAREMNIAWKKDGSAIIFSSDRDGDYDLYMVESDDPDEKMLSKALSYKVTRLTDTADRESRATMAPDGKQLAYVVGNGDLHILNLETNEDRVLLDHWDLGDFSWSPDSKWIAYARNDREFNADIWIAPADGSAEAVNITRHPDNEGSPVWSADGKRLAFASRRIDNNYDIWFVFLTKEDDERTKEDWEELLKAKKNGTKNPPMKKDDSDQEEKAEGEEEKKADEGPEVKIDFEDIHLRLRRVISMPGSEFTVAISPDGTTFAFVSDNGGGPDLYTVKWDGSELNQLTKDSTGPGGLQFNKAGNEIFFMRRGGMIQSVNLSGKPTMRGFSAKMTIDHPGERMQKYEEAWRTLDRLFYDGNFHGADWPAVREKFRPYAQAALEERDFADVVNMMFGNLNGSHLGYRGGFGGDGPSDNTGHLGLQFDPAYDGPGLKVKEVLKNGPTAKVASMVTPGQVLLAIDGTEVGWNTNIYKLLIDRIGEKVVLSIADADSMDQPKRVIVRPISLGEAGQLIYERFVDLARKQTHELSNGRIGYLHVQSMSAPSLERFEMELYSEAHDKDAIVIDVRNNGGGWTTDMMLAMLQVRDHATTSARGSDEWGYPQDRRPLYAWTKPIIVLCNEYSYSNAEIFSWSVKTLGRGKVVGQQTFGAVISTGGYGLIDGSFVRTPFRAWHVIKGDINMELNGCPPDIVVEYQNGDTAKGIDRQLQTAVEDLLSEISSN